MIPTEQKGVSYRRQHTVPLPLGSYIKPHLKKTLEKQGSLYAFNMTSSALLDRATIRHNLTEFKVR